MAVVENLHSGKYCIFSAIKQFLISKMMPICGQSYDILFPHQAKKMDLYFVEVFWKKKVVFNNIKYPTPQCETLLMFSIIRLSRTLFSNLL